MVKTTISWGKLQSQLGRHDAAREHFFEALDSVESLREELVSLSEREAIRYLAMGRQALDALLTSIPPGEDDRSVYQHALRWKGASMELLRARAELQGTGSPAARELQTQLNQTRRELANLLFTLGKGASEEERLS